MPVALCWVWLCRFDDLPSHGAMGFALKGPGMDDLFIVRREGLLRVYRNSCPHWPGASMPWRKHAYLDSEGAFIVCSGHGARFTLEEGVCVQGPCLGMSLDMIPVRVDQDGCVWIYI